MKRIIFGTGVVLILFALVSGLKYILDYSKLSSYGKGYLWGKLILLMAGLLLIFLGWRRKKDTKSL